MTNIYMMLMLLTKLIVIGLTEYDNFVNNIDKLCQIFNSVK